MTMMRGAGWTMRSSGEQSIVAKLAGESVCCSVSAAARIGCGGLERVYFSIYKYAVVVRCIQTCCPLMILPKLLT